LRPEAFFRAVFLLAVFLVAAFRVAVFLAAVLRAVFLAALFFRVAAPFFAEAERLLAGRFAAAAPPFLPPFFAGSLFSAFPLPDPDFLPPPDDLFTVAQARRSASFFETPFFS
jgi:hypothetical protein